MIDRSKDVCFSESSNLASFEVRKGARTVSSDDVSAYFAAAEGKQNYVQRGRTRSMLGLLTVRHIMKQCHQFDKQHVWRHESLLPGLCVFSKRSCKLQSGASHSVHCSDEYVRGSGTKSSDQGTYHDTSHDWDRTWQSDTIVAKSVYSAALLARMRHPL